MIRLATDSDSTYQPYSMTNKEITPYVQSISNPNLLDNPWFTVNQREFTSGSSTGYTADRWRASISSGASGTFTLSNGVMTIASDSGNVYLVQKVTNDNLTALIGKMLVVSIMLPCTGPGAA